MKRFTAIICVGFFAISTVYYVNFTSPPFHSGYSVETAVKAPSVTRDQPSCILPPDDNPNPDKPTGNW